MTRRGGVVFLPPLCFEIVVDDLVRLMERHEPTDFLGLALTSQRAVEALDLALASLGPEKRSRWSQSVHDAEGASRLPLFAIGQKTKRTVREKHLREADPDVEAPSAALLAEGITMWLQSQSRSQKADQRPKGPVLFLCGSKALADLANKLSEASINVCSVVVYRSFESLEPIEAPERLLSHLERSETPEEDDRERRRWIAFFSPSGFESLSRSTDWWRRFRVAAIGKTTASSLSSRGLCVEAVASSPNASSLLEAILSAPL